MKKLSKTDENIRPGLEMEFTALRGEILKRIELRQQLIVITLTFSGAFLGIGIKTPSVALVYPPLATLLALAWYQNDSLVRDMGAYIREHIESKIPGLGWQAHTLERRVLTKLSLWRTLSHGGVFVITQLLAVGVGLSLFINSPINWVLLSVDFLSLLIVARFIAQHRNLTK